MGGLVIVVLLLKHNILSRFFSIFLFRGRPFLKGVPSCGWLNRFLRRHKQLRVRVPSLNDPGQYNMSRAGVMDSFFEHYKTMLLHTLLLNEPSRIYNIDESWFNPRDEKNQKVVVNGQSKMPYKVFQGAHPHVTLTLCIRADGDWVAPMFTFKGSIPAKD